MTSPGLNPLEQLLRLDKSVPNFHDQINNVLYGKEYKQWVQVINASDAVKFVDYLDTVRRYALFFPLSAQATIGS